MGVSGGVLGARSWVLGSAPGSTGPGTRLQSSHVLLVGFRHAAEASPTHRLPGTVRARKLLIPGKHKPQAFVPVGGPVCPSWLCAPDRWAAPGR